MDAQETLMDARRVQKELAKEQRSVAAMARLKRIARRKFQTAFICPLSEFEAAFGHLWGHGLDESELTESQLEMRNKWMSVRDRVLNTGNTQYRGLLAELDLHRIAYDGYVVTSRGAGSGTQETEGHRA